MLLRSSSTPVLGSLLSSSFTDSPNCSNSNTIHHPEACLFKNHSLLPPTSPLHKHSSFHQNLSCTSSPISPSIAGHQNKGFRRVQSEGNLEDLAYTSYNNEDRFSYNMDPPPKRFSARQRCLTLETIPSFSLSKRTGLREEEEDEESDFEDEEERKSYEFSTTVMDSLTEAEAKVNMEDDRVCRVDFGEQEESKEMMYLAKGLGVDVCCDGIGGWGGIRGGGSGGDFNSNSMGSGGNDGDHNNRNYGVEEYYKKMVEANPGNPLFLRNYAQFLYQCKQDLEGAEEYYSRAILADPKDGEVLSQYGKLVWELHHDQERASSYFERAVQASPEDSHVHAAYASFLWDTEEDNEDSCSTEPQCFPQHFHLGSMSATSA